MTTARPVPRPAWADLLRLPRGRDAASASAGACSLLGFHAAGTVPGEEWLEVRCYEPDGSTQIYRRHDVLFMQGLGMKGIEREDVAYLLAQRPRAASYIPEAGRRYSSAGGAGVIRVDRLGTGRYRVTLPGMPRGGSAQVTPLEKALDGGTEARHCVVAGIARESLPQRIGVRCFDLAGQLADSRFTLAYAR